MKSLLAILFTLLAFIGGFAIGFGAIAYSIYLFILIIKGTVAVSFLKILTIVACWFIGPICGWLWWLSFIYIGAFLGFEQKNLRF